MVRGTFRWSCMSALTLALGACGFAGIPIAAPKDPIRIEATLVLKHEYVLTDPVANPQ